MKARWPTVDLGTCIEHIKRPITLQDDKLYRRVTVRLRGQGIELRDEISGSAIKTKKQFLVAEGDLLVAEIDAKVGAYGIVPKGLHGHIVSSHYFTYLVDSTIIFPMYLDYWLKTPAAHSQVLEFIRGSLNYAAIRPYHFPQIRIPMPPLDVQAGIVEKLEDIFIRVAEATRLRETIESEREEMLRAYARELAKDAPRLPLEEVAPITRHAVDIDKRRVYHELGVRSFGRGTFRKPDVLGAEWTWQRPYWMKKGDLLFSNIKAWEGAVAVIPDEFDGFVGSHRYITCRVNDSLATPEFLCQWLLTPEGLKHLGGSSPGATDRNRTLGLKKLVAIPVPVPPLEEQKKLSELCWKVTAARQVQDSVSVELKNIMPSLLDRAFSGDL